MGIARCWVVGWKTLSAVLWPILELAALGGIMTARLDAPSVKVDREPHQTEARMLAAKLRFRKTL